MKRIAINGFGRIGRAVLRIIQNRSDLQVVAINDLSDVDTMAYLLKYDSVHGRFPGTVRAEKEALMVNGKTLQVYSRKDPLDLPWKDLEVDVVLESTGHFLSRDKALLHIQAGAKKVLISAPTSGEAPDATICYGVNSNVFDSKMQVVSTASCTTNCIAPVAKVLSDHFGIKKASVTTIHSYTNDQQLLDLSHKDKRRARAAALSMIPTTTGAAKAVALVLPELEGKFDGMAIRVPTPNVSCIDLVAVLNQDTTVQEVNAKLREASQGILKGILGYTEDPVVSVDLNGTNESSIVDAGCTKVLGGNLVKVLAWYDNEWGFGNRAVDLLSLMAQSC
ncbi:MAG: type I glyceraldehyde-3-phosphate dehydrogenase [Myxococcaceae bacterium]|nr:type I glyceraldehyde-3-phosphate dehydrogenase [Myxococcaceae bacterium]MBH2005776.1 type I glyceraldehyde-3-phosphate dehydrogenase [Myxococcaceae bacterium]